MEAIPIPTLTDRTLLDSAAQHLPKPMPLHVARGSTQQHDEVHYFALPLNFKLEKIDTEALLQNPRRTRAQATADELDSFMAYVQRHADERTALWVKLDTSSSALEVKAQLDEHAPDEASWREHSIKYVPRMSVEWRRWQAMDGKPQQQAEFALFLEHNIADLALVEGMPGGGDMLQMALAFEARQDMRLKSHLRLQNGGVQLEYVGDDDDATIERMQMFDRFAIGVPVFWGGARYRIDARLRYRAREGKVTFWYDLVRPDRVHEAAARDLIAKLRESLPDLPLFMGAL